MNYTHPLLPLLPHYPAPPPPPCRYWWMPGPQRRLPAPLHQHQGLVLLWMSPGVTSACGRTHLSGWVDAVDVDESGSISNGLWGGYNTGQILEYTSKLKNCMFTINIKYYSISCLDHQWKTADWWNHRGTRTHTLSAKEPGTLVKILIFLTNTFLASRWCCTFSFSQYFKQILMIIKVQSILVTLTFSTISIWIIGQDYGIEA